MLGSLSELKDYYDVLSKNDKHNDEYVKLFDELKRYTIKFKHKKHRKTTEKAVEETPEESN